MKCISTRHLGKDKEHPIIRAELRKRVDILKLKCQIHLYQNHCAGL